MGHSVMNKTLRANGAQNARALQPAAFYVLLALRCSRRTVCKPNQIWCKKLSHSTTWYMEHHKASSGMSQYFFL